MAEQPKGTSRYERVKQILDDAQGSAKPSYQGRGPFWNLPLEEFLNVTIYGVRMIAPAGEEDFCADLMAATPHRSCCQDEEETPALASPPSRPVNFPPS